MQQIPKLKPRIVAPFNTDYKVVRHPRAYSKPVACHRGQHSFSKNNIKLINGLPHYVCSKCGDAIIVGVHNQTWTGKDFNDIRRIINPERKVQTTKERTISVWEKMEYLRGKGLTDKDINRMYKRKQMVLI